MSQLSATAIAAFVEAGKIHRYNGRNSWMSTDTGINWFEQTNAARLGRRIVEYWSERGKTVTVWTEPMRGVGIADAYVVRSDMKDGKPGGSDD